MIKNEETMINETDRMNELLVRCYEGCATPEEAAELEAWVEQSDKNRQKAERMFALLLAADSHGVEETLDVEAEWRRMKRRLGFRRPEMRWLTWMQRVAAVLFLPLLALSWWALTRPVPVRQPEVRMCEVRVKPGMVADLRLPDSTLVCLNSESVLRYPSAFVGDERRVELSGEAYFKVAKDVRRKFKVDLGEGVQVEVLGTHFNIDAYGGNVITTLTEGSVDFVWPAGAGEGRQRMQPGQKAVYDRADGTVELSQTDGEVELSWKEMKVVLRRTPFTEALHMLSKRYGVDFEVRTARYNTYTFTGTFTCQSVEEILDIFQVSSRVRWRVKERPDEDSSTHKLIEIY